MKLNSDLVAFILCNRRPSLSNRPPVQGKPPPLYSSRMHKTQINKKSLKLNAFQILKRRHAQDASLSSPFVVGQLPCKLVWSTSPSGVKLHPAAPTLLPAYRLRVLAPISSLTLHKSNGAWSEKRCKWHTEAKAGSEGVQQKGYGHSRGLEGRLRPPRGGGLQRGAEQLFLNKR